MINDKKAGPLPAKRIAASLHNLRRSGPVLSRQRRKQLWISREPVLFSGAISITPTSRRLPAQSRGGIRPVLILQNNVGNHHSPTVIAAAITGYVKGKRQPTHVRLKGAACGLFRDSTVLLEQVRTLDKSRLGEYMGSVGEDKMREVDAALNISVGLKNT